MIQPMLYQLPESIDIWHSVDEAHAPHHFDERRLKALLPSSWDCGGGKKIRWQEKAEIPQKSTPFTSSAPDKRLMSSTWRGHPAPLCQLGGKPFLMAAVSQGSHHTSRHLGVTTSFCSVVADPLTCVFQPYSYVWNSFLRVEVYEVGS